MKKGRDWAGTDAKTKSMSALHRKTVALPDPKGIPKKARTIVEDLGRYVSTQERFGRWRDPANRPDEITLSATQWRELNAYAEKHLKTTVGNLTFRGYRFRRHVEESPVRQVGLLGVLACI